MKLRNHFVDRLHVTEACVIDEGGSKEFVQPALPKEAIRPGRVRYDASKHYGRLQCLDKNCSAKLIFNKGSGVVCGGPGLSRRPHFKLAPDEKHSPDCEMPRSHHKKSDSRIDKNKPRRIHVNAELGGKPDAEHSVYQYGGDGTIVANDARLAPELTEIFKEGEKKIIKVYKEATPVRNVNDIINLIRLGEIERLKNSLVIYNTVIPWEKFAVVNATRMKDLVNRFHNGASHPVLLRVGLGEPVSGDCAVGLSIFFKRDDKGAHFITPRIFMDGPGTKGSFSEAGNYLVLGYPKLKYDQKLRMHFLDISLKDPSYVQAYSPETLNAEVYANAAKRQALTP